MKCCTKCNVEKSEELFVSKKNICKKCQSLYFKKYYNTNKKEHLEKTKIYRQNNLDSRKIYNKQYYKNNEDKIKNKQKQYRLNNKKKIRDYNNKLEKNKRLTDPSFRLRKDISRTIHRTLIKFKNSEKNTSCTTYLPYTVEELRKHIENQFEPWMNWNNQGKYNSKTWDDNDSLTWTWQIDHIIPQSALLFNSMEDDNFKKCWALENLRPLKSIENIMKNNKYSDTRK